MDQHAAMRRAQARHDSREEPSNVAPYRPGAVDEAIQYVRLAQRAGAPETPFELLVEATHDLAVRAEAGRVLGLGRLATTTAIRLRGSDVDHPACWGTCCLRFAWFSPEPWARWAYEQLSKAIGGAP